MYEQSSFASLMGCRFSLLIPVLPSDTSLIRDVGIKRIVISSLKNRKIYLKIALKDNGNKT